MPCNHTGCHFAAQGAVRGSDLLPVFGNDEVHRFLDNNPRAFATISCAF
jgi:hypothetical protein